MNADEPKASHEAAAARARARREAKACLERERRRDVVPRHCEDPAEIAEQKEIAERIVLVLNQLAVRDREAVLLRDLEGRSTREAATALYGSEEPRACGAFTHRLADARRRFRDRLIVAFEIPCGAVLPRWDAETLYEKTNNRGVR